MTPLCRRLAPLAIALAAVLPSALVGQRPDSIPELPPLAVRVTRIPELLETLGSAVTVIEGDALRRGRLAGGLDEALAFVPGVIATNRWNPSLDQRLIIRGFGARANFGVRGIKILVDGVPQTLPDGQSQLTNLDLGKIARIEILRGAASSAHGNAAGGVIAFTSLEAEEGVSLVTGPEWGSFRTRRHEVRGAIRWGRFSMSGSDSRTTADGFREHSGSEQRRLNYAIGWQPTAATRLTLRGGWSDEPRADNPGALTLTEAASTPTRAAPNNLTRNAGKELSQGQLSLGLDHAAGPWSAEVRAWGMTRTLDNPLAAPAPAPTTTAEGLWVGLDRRGGGARASATRRFDGGSQLTGGIDLQSSRDDRINRRHLGGAPFGAPLLDQRESVRELGLFAQAVVPHGAWQLRAGVRRDDVRFAVTDALGSGDGTRSMGAVSGHLTLARRFGSTTAWSGLSTSFETPTTSELANQPDGSTGLNRILDPQQSVMVEAGVRTHHPIGNAELVGWSTTTRDAITPFQEIGGRSYFTNAGRTRTRGIEAAVTIPLSRQLTALGTLTVTDATFRDYVVNGTQLAGRRVAGIPRTIGRVGVRGEIGAFGLDVDHAFSSAQYADDLNTLRVDGWGGGVTGVRVRWHAPGRALVTPFLAVQNVFDRRVIGSVTVNGGFGRVAEPSAGRTVSVGGTVRLFQDRRER